MALLTGCHVALAGPRAGIAAWKTLSRWPSRGAIIRRPAVSFRYPKAPCHHIRTQVPALLQVSAKYATQATTLEGGAGPFPSEALPTRSGYLEVGSASKSSLFYVFYEAEYPQRALSETPILLWLNGGPGCSSLIGCFYELGPWRVQGLSGQLERNEHAWNERYGVLFMDNPIGTGFSYASSVEEIPTDQPTVAGHLFHALSVFLEQNPELKGRPLFLTGESYAGKYVPWLASVLLAATERGEGLPCPLRGIAVGNGFTDPRAQVQVHADVSHNLGLLDKEQALEVEKRAAEVVKLIDREEWAEAHRQRTELCGWIERTAGIPTLLDVRRDAKYHATEDGTEYLAPFLNRPEVKAALNARSDLEWVSCRPFLRTHLASDTMKSSRAQVEAILAVGLPVLLYQGLHDAKDGPPSSEAWMRSLLWRESGRFWAAERKVWVVEGRRAGYWREWANLTHVVVAGAGHQVPVDQPLHSSVLIRTWIETQLEGGL